jgi:Ca2+/Na+ antiporter
MVIMRIIWKICYIILLIGIVLIISKVLKEEYHIHASFMISWIGLLIYQLLFGEDVKDY